MTISSIFSAIGGLFAVSICVSLTPVAAAQEIPFPPAPIPQVPDSDTVEFITDYVPTDCTTQFGLVAQGNLPEKLAEDFARTMDSAMVSQPVFECDAITATDNGDTRNFNFIRADYGVYKVITRSDHRFSEARSVYEFDVLGVRFIPIDAEGRLDSGRAQTMRSLAGGTCEVDNLETPYDAFCEFAATTEAEPEKLAVGQLSYLY